MKKFQNSEQKECYELNRRKDVSLIFMPGNEVTPYAVVCNLDYERGDWRNDNYTEGVSNAQRYKSIGNGWTVEVIAHILKHIKEVKG